MFRISAFGGVFRLKTAIGKAGLNPFLKLEREREREAERERRRRRGREREKRERERERRERERARERLCVCVCVFVRVCSLACVGSVRAYIFQNGLKSLSSAMYAAADVSECVWGRENVFRAARMCLGPRECVWGRELQDVCCVVKPKKT